MTDQSLGEILRDGDRRGLRYVRRLSHDATKVWRALTESDHLRSWMPCDIVGPRAAGAAISMPFWPEVAAKYDTGDEVPTGTIGVWDPPRVFEWSWDEDIVRFELDSDSTGATVLTLTTWIGTTDGPPLSDAAAGYHVCLDHLVQLLDTGAAPSVATSDPSPLEARYRELVTAAG